MRWGGRSRGLEAGTGEIPAVPRVLARIADIVILEQLLGNIASATNGGAQLQHMKHA